MFRRSACVVVAGLALTGCGIQLRTAPTVVMPATTTAATTARVAPILPTPPVDPLVAESVVVTLTFDDGASVTARSAQIVTTYGLRATYFVNSGTVGTPGHLTLTELDWIATNSGNEIAGHTVDDAHLEQLTPVQIKAEICNDRAALMRWGYPVRNFAYPFGYSTVEIQQVVADCGYNSARGYRTGEDIIGTVPPGNPLDTIATGAATAPELEAIVTTAVEAGGGWVQLAFSAISEQDLTDFVVWLADQQAQGRVTVRTVGEVVGGPVQPEPGKVTP